MTGPIPESEHLGLSRSANEDPALRGAREALLSLLRQSISDRLEPALARLFARLVAVRDRPMRSLLLSEQFRRFDATFCFAVLADLVDRAAQRDPAAQEALLDLTTARPLLEAVGYLQARRIYELASARGREDVARMLLSSEARAARVLDPRDKSRDNTKLPDESLGWRKTLARGSDRLKLDRLLFDRHPTVVRLLLDNPRILERDVVRIAAMRPTNPDNLTEIFHHRRWVTRYRVKSALANNPYTPIDIALACIPHMMLPELRYIAASGKLHLMVREAARDLVAQRAKSGDGFAQGAKPGISKRTDGTDEPGDTELVRELEGLSRQLEDWMADS